MCSEHPLAVKWQSKIIAMVSLNKRCAFQVGENPADERTLTLSSASNGGYYISLRPFVEPKDSESELPYEWAFAGSPKSLEAKKVDELRDEINFNFDFDTNVHLNAENTHRGVVETHWKKWESGLVEERGQVFPFGPDKQAVSFFELWQPIDATRDEFVHISEKSADQSAARSVVLALDDDNYRGLVITVGKWTQGILFKKAEHTAKGINFLRACESADGKITTLLKYGVDFDRFPSTFVGQKDAELQGAAGAFWKVVESNL